jgi:puromycin-sensitive aminopeptidase
MLAMANGWIRQTGYPVVDLALEDGGKVRLGQRRFFAEPKPSAASVDPRDPDGTRWTIPMVLRFRDRTGIKEQPVLMRNEREAVTLAADGDVAWCIGNSEARGFYRTAYQDQTLERLLPAVGELRPAERVALISDQWALVRADLAPVERFLDLIVGLWNEEDHVVLDEAVGRLSAIEHRFLGDEDRERFGDLVGKLFGARASTLGWSVGPGEDDETRLRRSVLLRSLVVVGRVPAWEDEAERRLPPAGGTGGLDPNLLDLAVVAAARRADPSRFEELRRRAQTETDPASKRRYLHALARVEAPELAAQAVELALSDDVPMQDFASYFAVLLANRATREGGFGLVRDRWAETRAKADSPMILRRVVESLGTLPERRHMEEVRAFLESHPIEGARQAIAQTLERMQMDVALRERILPRVAAWLRARR